MLVIRFKVQVQPDKIDEALEMFAAVPPPSREVEGVISFDIGRDLNDPNAIVATEVFQDAAARIAAHDVRLAGPRDAGSSRRLAGRSSLGP